MEDELRTSFDALEKWLRYSLSINEILNAGVGRRVFTSCDRAAFLLEVCGSDGHECDGVYQLSFASKLISGRLTR